MEHISLGIHTEIPVYAQKWRYLSNRTSKVIAGIIEGGADLGEETGQKSLIDFVGGSAYGLLTAMIPTVGKHMSEWEFNGFPTKQAWEADEYVEDLDCSPTVPEIEEAFRVAIRVNRFDLAKVLTTLIDPKVLKEALTARISSAISNPSQNSQQQNGESVPTSSMMTPPISMPNEVSLLSDWRLSQEGMPTGVGESARN